MVARVGGGKCPRLGESKIDATGAGAGCAPGCGGVLVVGARGGGGSSFGCAWWLLGCGAFPLVVAASGGNGFLR